MKHGRHYNPNCHYCRSGESVATTLAMLFAMVVLLILRPFDDSLTSIAFWAVWTVLIVQGSRWLYNKVSVVEHGLEFDDVGDTSWVDRQRVNESKVRR